MTKLEAAAKVQKLRRLAKRAGTPAEANSARKIADKLATEHRLTESDLSAGAKVDAFDDLIDCLSGFVKSKGKDAVPGTVVEVIERLKTTASIEEKRSTLDNFVAGLRIANLFGSKTVTEVKNLVDQVLANHDVTI